jgi:competence protein ComEC
LAYCFIDLGMLSYMPSNETLPQAKAAAQKALQLDDSLAEAHDAGAAAGLLEDTPAPGGGSFAAPGPFLPGLGRTPATPVGPVGEYALFTLAAQVTTLPLTAAYFHRLSIVALIANPVVLPAQPAVMVLGGAAALAGTVWLPLGRPLAWMAWPFVAFSNRVVEWFAGWPSASLPLGNVGPLVVVMYYVALFGLTFGWGRVRARWPDVGSRHSASAGLGVLAIACAFTWRAACDQPDGLLRVTVLDVGGAGAVLVQSPTGRSVLIDSGPSPVALAEALGRRLAFHDSGIDVYVMSGSPGVTCAGMQGLQGRFPVALAIVPMGISAPDCREAEAWLMLLGHTPRPPPEMAVDLGAGARLEVLSTGEHGLALGLSFDRARFPAARRRSRDDR